MKNWNYSRYLVLLAVLGCSSLLSASVQDSVAILSGNDLTRVVPTGFYFQGQSAATQMRNAAAARFGRDRFVIAGMVDTSGYAADVRAKYQGFFITDSPVTVNGSALGTGAYGFGFSNDGKLSILDLAGNEVLSVSSTKDGDLKRPRPLMMTKDRDSVRLYAGKDYVVVAVK